MQIRGSREPYFGNTCASQTETGRREKAFATDLRATAERSLGHTGLVALVCHGCRWLSGKDECTRPSQRDSVWPHGHRLRNPRRRVCPKLLRIPAEPIEVRPQQNCHLTPPVWSGARIGLYNFSTGPRRRPSVFSGSFRPGGMPRMWTQKNRFAFPPSRWGASLTLISGQARGRPALLQSKDTTPRRHCDTDLSCCLWGGAGLPGGLLGGGRRHAASCISELSCRSGQAGGPTGHFLGRLEATLPPSQGCWVVNNPQGTWHTPRSTVLGLRGSGSDPSGEKSCPKPQSTHRAREPVPRGDFGENRPEGRADAGRGCRCVSYSRAGGGAQVPAFRADGFLFFCP